MLIGVFGINATNGDTDDSCNSVTNVFLNRTFCDRKSIVIEGKVRDLNFNISSEKNKFTTFNISDGNNNITVFSYEYLRIAEGDLVRVTGTYYTKYLYKNYSFDNEIVTIPSLVNRLEPGPIFQINVLIVLLVITLCISIISRKKITQIIKKLVPPLHPVDENKQDSRVKGDMFEEYIISLLDRSNVSIERTKERDAVDILVKRFNPMSIIAIECKYRSELKEWRGRKSFEICERKEMNKYRIYQKTQNTKVLFFCGLGGEANNPSDIFIIPLDRIREGYSWYPEYMLGELKLKDRTNKITFNDLLRWLPQNPI